MLKSKKKDDSLRQGMVAWVSHDYVVGNWNHTSMQETELMQLWPWYTENRHFYETLKSVSTSLCEDAKVNKRTLWIVPT